MTDTHLLFFCFLPFLALAQNDADIRLVNHLNNNTFEGRVEIYHGTEWGTICDDYFGMEEADVVCKQLNFTLGAQAVYKKAYYGQGTGKKIYLDNVVCVGNETSLINCKHQGWNGHNCHHFEDVGVVCLTNEEPYSTPGSCDFEKGHGLCGYQRVSGVDQFNWTFGSRQFYSFPKTDHTTSDTDGEGFYLSTVMKFTDIIEQGKKARIQSPTVSAATCLVFYYFMAGTSVGELIVYLKDAGKESLVWELFGDQGRTWKKAVIPIDEKYKGFNIIFEGVAGTRWYGNDVCIDDITVTVTTGGNCTFSPPEAKPRPAVTPKSNVRLVPMPGSSVKSAGRVEVFHNAGSTGGRWGTICDGGYGYRKTFDLRAATVVCKELGYEGAEMVVPCCQVFGKGSGRIWLDNVECLGTEPSITMCPHSGWGNTFCSHLRDVAVVCKTKDTDRSEFAVRLRGRAGVPYKGRVEVNIGGIWGTVTDHGWDIYDANVVCKQLHFGGAVGAYTGSSYGVGKGPVWMSDFECNGNEDSLAKCNHSNTEVQKRWAHYMDASVECFGLRLANGRLNMTGRVEVMYDGKWGTVCNTNWNINAANVVCRQLGFRRAEDVGFFGAGSGSVLLDRVNCTGDEPSLSFCRHSPWNAHSCNHDKDAGVECTHAICGKSKPCLNGGNCESSTGTCNCTSQSFVGDFCDVPVANDTVQVLLDGKFEKWDPISFKTSLVKRLNDYCSKVNCPGALSTAQKNHLHFEYDDVHIIDRAKKSDKGVVVNFAVVYTNGVNTSVLPKQFIHQFFSSNIDNLAGFKVREVDGESEMPPGGHHSAPQQQKSNSLPIYIGVGVVAFVAVLVVVVVFVVKRYGKKAGGGRSEDGPSGYSYQSYLVLHAEDDDEATDDTTLLRPPQQGSGEGDLLA